MANAYPAVRSLRAAGCELPVELYYAGPPNPPPPPPSPVRALFAWRTRPRARRGYGAAVSEFRVGHELAPAVSELRVGDTGPEKRRKRLPLGLRRAVSEETMRLAHALHPNKLQAVL